MDPEIRFMNKRFKTLGTWLRIDRGLFFTLLSRAWQFLAGPVSIVIVASSLSSSEQGFYYTFSSLIALQSLIEMGTGQSLIQFISHEFANLNFNSQGRIEGSSENLDRVLSIGKTGIIWYSVIAAVFFLVVTPVGIIFFWKSPADVNWMLPWVILCFATSGTLLLQSYWFFMEGCNKVGYVYLSRFVFGATTAITTWIALGFHLKLVAVCLGASTSFVVNLGIIIWSNKALLLQLLSHQRKNIPNITNDIKKMQSRIAVSWISGYLIYSFMVPMVFKVRGASEAGRLGMSWNVIQALAGLSSSWVTSKGPSFGILISKKLFFDLNDLFWSNFKRSISVFVLGSIVAVIAIYLFHHSFLFSRFIDWISFGILCLGLSVTVSLTCFATYLRAFKQEPYMWLSLFNGVGTGAAVYLGAKLNGIPGMAIAFLIVQIAALAWGVQIFGKCKSMWTQTIAQSA